MLLPAIAISASVYFVWSPLHAALRNHSVARSKGEMIRSIIDVVGELERERNVAFRLQGISPYEQYQKTHVAFERVQNALLNSSVEENIAKDLSQSFYELEKTHHAAKRELLLKEDYDRYGTVIGKLLEILHLEGAPFDTFKYTTEYIKDMLIAQEKASSIWDSITYYVEHQQEYPLEARKILSSAVPLLQSIVETSVTQLGSESQKMIAEAEVDKSLQRLSEHVDAFLEAPETFDDLLAEEARTLAFDVMWDFKRAIHTESDHLAHQIELWERSLQKRIVSVSIYFLFALAGLASLWVISRKLYSEISVIKDVGEKEQKLMEVNRVISDIANDCIWRWDFHKQHMQYGKRFEEILGYGPEEVSDVLGSWQKMIHAEDEEGLQKALKDHWSSGTKTFCETLRFIHKDGSIRWLNLKASTILNRAGEKDYMLGVATDMTLINEYEKKLNQLKWHYEERLDKQEGLTFSIKKIGQQFIHVLCRGRLFDCIGFTLKDIETKSVFEVLSYERAKNWVDNYEKAWSGKVISFEDYSPENDIYFLIHLEPIYKVDKVFEVIGYCIDITSIKEFEKELTRVNTIVEVKNSELVQLNSQLEESIERANEIAQEAYLASQAKSDFLADMSHEIRTPMNAILGMASLLDYTVLNEEQKKYLDSIQKSTSNLLAITDDILDFSKIEAGAVQLECISLSPKECIVNLVNLFGFKVRDKRLEFIYYIAGDVPEQVKGDPVRINQILINLVGNAIKFTNEGEITVKLCCEKIDNKSLKLIYSAEDTGIGMSKGERKKVFSEFTQANNSTTRNFGGTGLGLSISRKLCMLMGGSISVKSKKGVGSIFTFDVVVERVDGIFSENKRDIFGGKQILFIEENARNRSMTTSLMSDWGIKVHDVDSIENGLIFLKENDSIEGVVVSIDSAKTSVQEVIICIRETVGNDKIPILVLVFGTVFDFHKELEVNKDAILLAKPFEHESLLLHLKFALGMHDLSSEGSHEKTGEHGVEGESESDIRILVVEDNEANRVVAELLLKHMGYRVETANDGVDALKKVSEKTYDIVFMDVLMPNMDGYEATEGIRKHLPEEEQPYIVALTASVTEGYKKKCLDVGMNDFLTKPLNMEEVRGVLEGVQKRLEEKQNLLNQAP